MLDTKMDTPKLLLPFLRVGNCWLFLAQCDLVFPHLYCHCPCHTKYLIPSVSKPLFFFTAIPYPPSQFSTSSPNTGLRLSVFWLWFSTFQNPRLFYTALLFVLLSVPITTIISPSSNTSSASLLHCPLFVLHIRCVYSYHHYLRCTPHLFYPCTTVSFVPVISSLMISCTFQYARAGIQSLASAIPPTPFQPVPP